MIEYITEDQYRLYMAQHAAFEHVLKCAAIEICEIEWNRTPDGDFDYELLDSNEYMTSFESYCCGESDYDSIRVPCQYLYDAVYRAGYPDVIAEHKRKQREDMRRGLDERKAAIERFDLAQYERLKAKYEVE